MPFSSGQISGFFPMADFEQRFGEYDNENGQYEFSATRQGTIVGLLSVGALFGSLAAGGLAETLGRRLAISVSALLSCVGTAIEISSQQSWVQFAAGRLVNGLAIGSLSVLVPMYQSESSPAIIRGIVVSMYQLFIMIGIWSSEMANFGTHHMASSASWRIPNGLGFLWAIFLGTAILFLPESPRYAYRRGRTAEARLTIAYLSGLDANGPSVDRQIAEISAKLDEEQADPNIKWHAFITGPRMLYRIVLGIVLQAGQQLTGINFFFYYGTTIFQTTGMGDSYATQIILGTVSCVFTFGGLYVAAKCGRRRALMVGAVCMTMCFLVYALVGRFALDGEKTPAAGIVLIVVSCLFIAAFTTTWGPLVWAVVAELYPARYRASAMAVATASNWFWNFMISFFTPFITNAIDYMYGLVFAGCCATLVVVVFFFLIESKDRSLEEIDTMYILKVSPITSSKWGGGKQEALREGRTE